MPDVLAFLLPLAQSTAEEGKRVITGMLITGLVFALIVVLGEWWHYRRHLRHRRRY
jgi:hypothetical protein